MISRNHQGTYHAYVRYNLDQCRSHHSTPNLLFKAHLERCMFEAM